MTVSVYRIVNQTIIHPFDGAGAKNFQDTVIVASVNDYSFLYDLLSSNDGNTTLENRKSFATKAFNITSHYDAAIFNYFNLDNKEQVLKISEQNGKWLVDGSGVINIPADKRAKR